MLDESTVRKKIKMYFNIRELVGARTYNKYKERAWRFLDYRLLYALLIVREGLNTSISVNTSSLQQRGLRTIVQQIVRNKSLRNVLYISPHIQGKAVDFNVKGLTAQEVRTWIVNNGEKFPFKIRLEDDVTWVHLDTIHEEKNKHIYLFKP